MNQISNSHTEVGDITPARPHYQIEDIHRTLGPLADYLSANYGILTGAISGADTPVECPIHRPGHTTSANVHDYGNKQVFTCFRCDITADVIDLVKKLDHLDTAGATQKLGEWLRLTPSERVSAPHRYNHAYKPRQTSRTDLRDRMDADRRGEPFHVKESLERLCDYYGWHIETVEQLDIHLAKRTFKDGEVASVMRFPFTTKGMVVGWQDRTKRTGAKWMSGWKQKLPAYNLDAITMVDESEIIITEGISDCVSLLDSYGMTYPVIGIPGAATVTRELMAGLQGWRVVYVPDNDAAGSKMAERIESYSEFVEPVRVDVPPEYSDLTDWKKAVGDRVDFAERFELAIINALSERTAA